MPAASFPKSARLLKRTDFDRVFTARVSARSQSLLIRGVQNNMGASRIGLVVSRRVGNAIARNRWKRLLREAFRLSREELPRGVDLVVIPMRSQPPALADLRRELVRVARRVHRRIAGRAR